VCLWLRRTPCVLSFIASFAGLGQPLGHFTVFDLLFRREIITFWPAGKPCLARA